MKWIDFRVESRKEYLKSANHMFASHFNLFHRIFAENSVTKRKFFMKYINELLNEWRIMERENE